MQIRKVENKLGKLKKISAIVSAAATAGILVTTLVRKGRRKKGILSFIRN